MYLNKIKKKINETDRQATVAGAELGEGPGITIHNTILS